MPEPKDHKMLRLGKLGVAQRPAGEVYLLESEVIAYIQEIRKLIREAADEAREMAARAWMYDRMDER